MEHQRFSYKMGETSKHAKTNCPNQNIICLLAAKKCDVGGLADCYGQKLKYLILCLN